MEEAQAVFNDKVWLPVKPMIGVISVAPKGEPVPRECYPLINVQQGDYPPPALGRTARN